MKFPIFNLISMDGKYQSIRANRLSGRVLGLIYRGR